MLNHTVMRDERTEAVENSSYRIAYLVLSFGLLGAVMYRAFVLGESSWDLLALVIGAGLIATAYQGLHRVLTKRWALTAALITIAACAIAAVLALSLRG